MSSPALPAGPEGVLSASFNQDFSCVAVATCRGFKIYSFDAGAWVYEDAVGAVRIVEMLHTSSLLAVVGAGDAPDLSPRRVKVLNTSTRACIADLAFTSTVLAVRLNRACLVVVEERRAVVHDLSTLAVQRVIDTPPNPRGVVALASDPDASALAVPSAEDSGVVHVHDCVNHHVACEVRAHDSPIAALALTPDGRMLATASEKGTVVRVHVLPAARLCYTFRRGAVPANVRTLAFGPPAAAAMGFAYLLLASTDKGTAHVFRVEGEPQPRDARGRAGGATSAAGRMATAAAGFFGGAVAAKVTDAMRSKRDAATVRLPPATVRLAADVAARGGVGVGGVCALRDATSADERRSSSASGAGEGREPTREMNRRHVRVVGINGDALMCEYDVDLESGTCSLERECSVADAEGAAFAGAAKWIRGGDAGGDGDGGGEGDGEGMDVAASMSAGMGGSLFESRA